MIKDIDDVNAILARIRDQIHHYGNPIYQAHAARCAAAIAGLLADLWKIQAEEYER